jgi:hypothetical protein
MTQRVLGGGRARNPLAMIEGWPLHLAESRAVSWNRVRLALLIAREDAEARPDDPKG